MIPLIQLAMVLIGAFILFCFWKSAVVYGPDDRKQANRWGVYGLWAVAALIACFLLGLAAILLRKP